MTLSIHLSLLALVASFIALHCEAFCALPHVTQRAASFPQADALTSTKDPEADETSSLSSSSSSSKQQLTSIFIDVAIPSRDESNPLRLVFHIPQPNLLPRHAENIIALAKQSRRSIDSRCHYVGCAFRHSPQFVEGFPQYRWAHVLDGRKINAVGQGPERIEEREAMTSCKVTVQGSGDYYGYPYDPDRPIVLTVPLVGPGRGSTSFSIVRVGDSPQEWGERLLINSAVIGWMDDACSDALVAMAAQTDGPPTVVDSGVLE